LVPRLKALIEAAASQHNEADGGNPRGDLSTDEDVERVTEDGEDEEPVDPKVAELIKAAGL
jgi:hypothetical protein